MKAIVLRANQDLVLSEISDPVANAGEVIVEIRAAALNHRDVWIKNGQYAGLTYPSVLGSDGAGVVRSVGPDVPASWLGREVILNPSFDWGQNEAAQGKAFTILGLPKFGTLAQQIQVPVAQLGLKPEGWSFEQAAALPLAGLTAYRALFSRAKIQTGEKVLISGIGGGVAVFALQFAVAAGAQVWVTSSSAEKITKAVSLGAKGGFDYRQPGWAKEAVAATGGFDVIVDSAAGAGFDSLLDAAAPGARIAVYGATRGAVPELQMRKLFWKQLSLLGSTMGSPGDWSALVNFVSRHQVRPMVSSVHRAEAFADAFAEMEAGSQFGKIVVTW